MDYRWHYLEDHRPRSEWDNLWRVINEQAPIGKEDYDLGQVLVRLVRHRDGSGSVAKIRALQAMKELSMLEHELEILTGAVTGTRKVVNKLLKSNKKGNYVDNGSSSTASLLSNPSPPSSPQQNREVLTDIKLPSTENSSILLEKSKLLATSINRLAEKVVIKKGLMSPPP